MGTSRSANTYVSYHAPVINKCLNNNRWPPFAINVIAGDNCFTNPESYYYHYSILGAGCQLVQGNGNLLSCRNRWSVATWDGRNIRTNESTQHLKRWPCHSKMLQPETFCKVSLHHFLPERLIAWSLPDPWASSHKGGYFEPYQMNNCFILPLSSDILDTCNYF